MKKIVFLPRARKWIEDNRDTKIGTQGTLQEKLGEKYQVLTLDFTGKFDIDDGGQLYVMPGHGMAGCETVFWKEPGNSLSAQTVAELTAERFPDCTGVSIKIYSCHSSEGGYNSFASRFARAFRPAGGTYDVTIFGYRGATTPTPIILTEGNVINSNSTKLFPPGYTGPAASVVAGGVPHRWSKAGIALFQSRASEARDKVAWLKAVKGVVSSVNEFAT
jgi:hypothetical protein